MTSLFQGYPTYTQFRPLSHKDPMIVGEDVYGLQTALTGCGYPCGVFDGYLGPATGKSIWQFQTAQNMLRDGIVGPATNNRLVEVLAAVQTGLCKLPVGLLFGHLAHESSFYPGRYSPRRPDGSFDAGVAQRNTAHHSIRDAFDAPDSIRLLANNERAYFDKFEGVDGRRRWLLAAGAWNAPAWSCYLAKQEGATGVRAAETAKPSSANRATFEQYMVACTVLMA